MAQTKASSRSKGSSSRSGSSAQKRTNGRAKQSSRSKSTASRNGRGSATKGLESVKETVTSGAQTAAHEVADKAKNAKTVLLAGGAAAAGAATAVAVSRSGKKSRFGRRRGGIHLNGLLPRRNRVKVNAKKIAGTVTDAAKSADKFGQRVSNVASSVQKVSETADEAAKKA